MLVLWLDHYKIVLTAPARCSQYKISHVHDVLRDYIIAEFGGLYPSQSWGAFSSLVFYSQGQRTNTAKLNWLVYNVGSNGIIVHPFLSLFCFVFVLFCFVLFCFVLFCFVLFCFVFSFLLFLSDRACVAWFDYRIGYLATPVPVGSLYCVSQKERVRGNQRPYLKMYPLNLRVCFWFNMYTTLVSLCKNLLWINQTVLKTWLWMWTHIKLRI